VKVYVYGGRSAALWWAQNEAALARVRNLSVIEVADSVADTVTAIAERNMRLDCTIQDAQVWLAVKGETLHFEPRMLKSRT
jgi:uncharacterized protein YaeQ